MSDDNVQAANLQGNSLLDGALFYASQGRKVFRLDPRGKEPLQIGTNDKGKPIREQFSRTATTDENTIRAMWAAVPDANIGALPKENEVVADVDAKPGKPNGWTTLNGYLSTTTPLCLTPNRGGHFYYEKPSKDIGGLPGVDVKRGGNNEYLVMPPSAIYPDPPATPFEEDRSKQLTSYVWDPGRMVGQSPPEHMAPSLVDRFPERSKTPSQVDIPMLLEQVPPIPLEHLKPFQATFLQTGNIEGAQELKDQSGSGVVLSLASTLYLKGYDDSQVLTMLWNNSHVHATATKDRKGGLDWLWHYNCVKARENRQKDVTEVFSPVENASPVVQDHTQWVEDQITKRAKEGKAPVGASRYKLQTFVDVKRSSRAPQWLVNGYIQEGDVVCFYGESSTMKSFIAQHLACAVATGGDFFGNEIPRHGPVAFLAGEGERGLPKRIEGWRQHHRVDDGQMERVGLHIGPLDLAMQQGEGCADRVQDMFDRMVYQWQEFPILIVLDTLSTNMSPGKSIQSNDDMGEFVCRLKELGHRYGCAWVFVHHVGKGDKYNPKGATAIAQNADATYLVEKMGPNLSRVVNAKDLKDAEGAGAFWVKGTVQHVENWQGDSGESYFQEDDNRTTLVLELVDEGKAATQKTEKLSDQMRVLVEHIHSRLENRSEISLPEIWDDIKRGDPGDPVSGGMLYARKDYYKDALERLHKRGLIYLDTEKWVIKRTAFSQTESFSGTGAPVVPVVVHPKGMHSTAGEPAGVNR